MEDGNTGGGNTVWNGGGCFKWILMELELLGKAGRPVDKICVR